MIETHREFQRLLPNARGIARFGIAISYDIRGFTSAATRLDTSQVALWIKRIYRAAMEEWFANASFFKAAGDGGLVIVAYDNQEDLGRLGAEAIERAWRAVDEYPKLVVADPMLNFRLPMNLGIGIARGPLCELRSEDRVLDYCGSAINLACRLTDLARPRGVVVDGRFGLGLIPEAIRSRLEEIPAYLPGLAESAAVPILMDQRETCIPIPYRRPLGVPSWQRITHMVQMGDLKSLGTRLALVLPSNPSMETDVHVRVQYPTVVAGEPKEGYISEFRYAGFSIDSSEPEVRVVLELRRLVSQLEEQGVEHDHRVEICVTYPEQAER